MTKTKPDYIQSRNEKTRREKIISSLLNFYFQWVESGHPDHVITRNEAEQILKLKKSKPLDIALRESFGSVATLTDVLKILNLPTEYKTSDNFNETLIKNWFSDFLAHNGEPPNIKHISEAIKNLELPSAERFQNIMKESMRSYSKNYRAKWEVNQGANRK